MHNIIIKYSPTLNSKGPTKPSLLLLLRSTNIMDVQDDCCYKGIIVTSITMNDRKKPFWMSVNYIIKGSEARAQKAVKKFPDRQSCRNGKRAFCESIDAKFCQQLNFEPKESVSPQKKAKVMQQAVENVDLNLVNVRAARTSPALPLNSKNSLLKLKNNYSHKLNMVLEQLQKAIITGNFSEILPESRMFFEMDDIDQKLNCVSDLTPCQQARLTEQAIVLKHYYKRILVAVSKLPEKNVQRRRHLKKAKTEAIAFAVTMGNKTTKRTMYRLVKSFEANGYNLQESRIGKHERRWIVNNEIWGRKCRDFVRESAVKKGAPNMRVEDFQKFVNSEILPQLKQEEKIGLSESSLRNGINATTARKWLHYLGCFFKEGRKDVYFDGHEREDVVKYRDEFIPRLLQYFDDPNTVVVFQDEVIYKSFESQTAFWHVPENVVTGETPNMHLKKKGGGWGIMLSGFTTGDGFIVLTEQEYYEINMIRASEGRTPLSTFTKVLNTEVDGELGHDVLYFGYQLFEYGKNREGYWDAEKMIQQTGEVISALEYKYPGKKLVFLFDWSSGHDKKPKDAVILGNMNKGFGGKQSRMRQTTLLENFRAPSSTIAALKAGDIQSLVFLPGDPPPFYDQNAENYIGEAKGMPMDLQLINISPISMLCVTKLVQVVFHFFSFLVLKVWHKWHSKGVYGALVW